MILEAIKNKRFQDFGVLTPDEKLRSDLGDEIFDKIQASDPEQSEMFKQSFGYKKGGVVGRFKKGGIIQYD